MIRYKYAALALLCTQFSAQVPEVQKPTISIKAVPPNPVPQLGCKQDRYGFLENADDHNRLTPYTPTQIAQYLDARLRQGYVVTLYPQPKGKLWVEAICQHPEH